MDLIQRACERLSSHADSVVRDLGKQISDADHIRDDEMTVLKGRLSSAKAQMKTLKAEIARMEERLKDLKQMHFGPNSEKSESEEEDGDGEDNGRPDSGGEESSAGNEGGLASKVTTAPPQTKQRGMLGRQKVTIPDHLRREEKVVEPDPSQFCSCGCRHRVISEQVIERLAYKPAEVYVEVLRYPKYSCQYCDLFVQAPAPDRALPNSRYSESLVIAILIAKYADFLPLFRLQQIFGRSGVRINRTSLTRLVMRASKILRPIYEALIADLKSSSKLFMDETRIPLLDPGRGKTKTCYAWALCRDDRRWGGNKPPAVAFHFATSREGRHAEELLTGFSGTLQVDGYAAYLRLTDPNRPGGPVVLANCWTHVRRRYWFILKNSTSLEAKHAFDKIKRIYAIEAEIKGQPAALRQAVRAERSTQIVDGLFSYLEQIRPEIRGKSKLGEAIDYTMKLQDGLRVFLSDGRVEIDTDDVEKPFSRLFSRRLGL
ncbi:IS66 family transposase, partial [Acidimangrovimonas sediminis]|uniref:IS66 family transposase n=1 Tax=Acidimangrovimonas sediminis TaxID=2056283 RepID=UPI000C80E101